MNLDASTLGKRFINYIEYNYATIGRRTIMVECETVMRKWGNSLGITLPKEIVESQHLKEHQKIKILVLQENAHLSKIFGLAKGKWKKSAQQIKDDIRKKLHHAR